MHGAGERSLTALGRCMRSDIDLNDDMIKRARRIVHSLAHIDLESFVEDDDVVELTEHRMGDHRGSGEGRVERCT